MKLPDKITHSFRASEEKVTGIPKWKRILDLTCILLTLPIWWILMVLVAAWIKMVSHGPVFYCQERVGLRGKPFMMLKFRTMKVCSETRSHERYFDILADSDHPMTKLDVLGDSRMIPGGYFLRASGLDELPQFFNVLRSEMTLVGPRPCTPHEFPKLWEASAERFEVEAGITGHWQVNGKNRTTFRRMIDLDVYYARKVSIWLDLWIILRTLPAIYEQVLESWRICDDEIMNQDRGMVANLRKESVARDA